MKQKLTDKGDRYTCSICDKQCVGYSNNAWPINNGRCCNHCNAYAVVPARLALMYEREGRKDG